MRPVALVLFGKVPLPGRVKTRLADSIGPEGAAALSEAFLRDAAREYARLAGDPATGGIALVLAADPATHPFWRDVFPNPWRIEPQPGGDLGQRIAAAFEREFERFERVAVLGSDHPSLPSAELRRFLSSSNAIWPTRDGGYAALVLSKNPGAGSLFEGIDWSTERVFDQTFERAARASIRLEVFPKTYDVDREEDLDLLARDLESRDPDDAGFPRETRAALRLLRSRGPRVSSCEF